MGVPNSVKPILRAARFGCVVLLCFCGVVHTAERKATSEWVYPGPDGKLVYKTTSTGDRIMDFSHAGYMGGGVSLPDVSVKMTVRPSGKDDTAAIQSALDAVSQLPLKDGFRGAVLLEPGEFTLSRTITVSTSGVVLRGSGAEGPTRSTLKMTGRPFNAITVRLSGGRSRGPSPPSAQIRTTLADNYVPSGAIQISVVDASRFSVGDTIHIRKPITAAWVELMQMHDLVRDGRPQTWLSTGSTIDTERRIAAVSGNTITLDVPLSDSYDSAYLNPPGTEVIRLNPPERIRQAGVESLHILSPLQPISHSQPHFTALRMNGQDCWAKNLVIEETMNSVSVGGRRITLQNVAVNRKARHQGSSRPAEFAPNGSQVLLDRCSVNADNVWFVATGGRLSGPIVVLNGEFRGDSRAESHQRWATGMLFDNVRAPQGAIEFRNRGSMGSGHGWSMGWGVLWNCVADHYIVQQPPGAANWVIGCVGRSRLTARPFGSEPLLPEGILDSHNEPVTPQSLYLAQLAERLGTEALGHIGY
ncbi:MAG TPA: hypothetical protein ENN97_04575 [Phycisphaerales bacterium]|nr:hypothetical protein [Phycisphaerales bacterium]